MFESEDEYERRVGSIDFESGVDFRSRGQVLRDLVLAVSVVLAFTVVTIWSSLPEVKPMVIALALFATYCTLAYFMRVRPNHDEIGAVDNPFRSSDTANRGLIQLAALLAIGRFVSFGLVDGFYLLKTGQLPQDRFMRRLEQQTPSQ